MNYAALRNEILTGPRASDCALFVITNDMPKQDGYPSDKAIADILNDPIGVRVVENYCNAIEIMARLGSKTGATILDKLNTAALTNSPLNWAMLSIKSERGIDLGHTETREMIDELVAGMVLTSQEGALLKGLAERPSSIAYNTVGQPVTWADVSIALRGNHEFNPGL